MNIDKRACLSFLILGIFSSLANTAWAVTTGFVQLAIWEVKPGGNSPVLLSNGDTAVDLPLQHADDGGNPHTILSISSLRDVKYEFTYNLDTDKLIVSIHNSDSSKTIVPLSSKYLFVIGTGDAVFSSNVMPGDPDCSTETGNIPCSKSNFIIHPYGLGIYLGSEGVDIGNAHSAKITLSLDNAPPGETHVIQKNFVEYQKTVAVQRRGVRGTPQAMVWADPNKPVSSNNGNTSRGANTVSNGSNNATLAPSPPISFSCVKWQVRQVNNGTLRANGDFTNGCAQCAQIKFNRFVNNAADPSNPWGVTMKISPNSVVPYDYALSAGTTEIKILNVANCP